MPLWKMALDSSDIKLAEKLRREDPEQFQTLVRMHLSFVLDLNTDDCQKSGASTSSSATLPGPPGPGSILHVLSSMWKDACICVQALRFNQQHDPNLHFICYDCAVEKNKYRPSKWAFVPFAKKAKCLSRGVMEGAPLTQEGICQVYQLIEYLSKEPNNCQEGIFRRSGKLTRQQELKTLLNQGMALNLDNSHFSIHDCASVLKNFLAELPEPLLTDAHYPVYCQIAELCGAVSNSPEHVMNSSEIRLLRSLQLLLLLLPMENRVLLRDVLQLLHLTASQESSNKMSADSLSTLFTPHLLCPRKLTPEAFHANSQTMSGVVAFMIRQGLELFEIPPKLATDIRAYWLERERRKKSAEKELNESVCDSTAANTVFSFVDREMTARAHSSNPTESALAQLYAHIQSLPESSKKKKLIRQFNKGNGQGTPLQKHHLRSKSLGDSIKRHIFNKSLKRQKNIDNSGHFGARRSLSQEMISSPRTPVSKMKLFQSSLEEESNSSNLLDNLPDLKKSLFDSNSGVVRLRYSTRVSKSSVVNRLVFSDSESICHEEASGNFRKAVLHNLASQVAEKHDSGSRQLTTTATCDNEDDGSSPSKSPRLTEQDESPPIVINEMCPPSSTPRNPRGFRRQGTDIWPVSNSSSAFFCVPPSRYDRSIESPSALPGFFSPPLLVRNTNNNNRLTTPWNARSNFLMTSTPASQSLLRASANARGPNDSKRTSLNHSSCLLTPIADENNSMSPITRSTQRMPKAMQETMMTPRSRKPVIVLSGSNLCHLANITNLGRPGGIGKQQVSCTDSKNKTEAGDSKESMEYSINNSQGILSKRNVIMNSCCGCNQPSCPENITDRSRFAEQDAENHLSHPNSLCCDSGDSLTCTFKSYLMSRSVLTASPVDLSFSSRTGDFDTSSCSEDRILSNEPLSDSLLYCLDGNEPSTSSTLGSGEMCSELPAAESECCELEVEHCSPEPELANRHGLVMPEVNEISFIDKYPSISKPKLYRKGVIHETSL